MNLGEYRPSEAPLANSVLQKPHETNSGESKLYNEGSFLILEQLLKRLLDLRLDKKLPFRYEEAPLSLELLFCLPHRSLDASLEPLVRARIDQLRQKDKPIRKGSDKELLELAQLYGWLAYRSKWLYHLTQEENSLVAKEGWSCLETCIKSILQLQRQSKLGWLFKRKFMKQTQFLIQAIRLEMKEIKLPQKILESTLAEDAKSSDIEKKLYPLLVEKKLNLALILSNKLLKREPYSLRRQIMQAMVQQAYRLELTFQGLLNPSRLQASNYRYHLLDRADRAIKVFCWQLRHSARYPHLSLDLLNPLGSIASEHWSQLQAIYEKEYSLKNPQDPVYWRLWLQAQILALGARLGGGGSFSVEGSLSTLDSEEIEGVLQSLKVARAETLQVQAVQFLVTLLVLVNLALKDRQEIGHELIELLRRQLEALQGFLVCESLKKKIADHVMDLPLLYHRDMRSGPFELLRAIACLFAIYPQSSDKEVLNRSLELLEGIYDLWSGSSFQSS